MTGQPSFPARLHVLTANNSPNAIIIRRGPSKRTCVLSWDLRTDDIIVSQWLSGRIYERRSDISPDGKYWIYFAMNGRWNSEVKGSWTAVALAPWLKAVSLFSKGDCWYGGGLFTGDRSYWLNQGCGHQVVTEAKELKRVSAYEGLKYYGGECTSVYYNRLQRDGWRLRERESNGRYDEKTIFEKDLPHGWTFRKICHEQVGAPKGKGCYWDEHVLISNAGTVANYPDWEWAELVNGYIAFAKRGSLFRISIQNDCDLGDESLIHDFNEYKFEQLEAPC